MGRHSVFAAYTQLYIVHVLRKTQGLRSLYPAIHCSCGWVDTASTLHVRSYTSYMCCAKRNVYAAHKQLYIAQMLGKHSAHVAYMQLYIVHVLRKRSIYAVYTQLYIAHMLGRHSVCAAYTQLYIVNVLRIRSVDAAYADIDCSYAG